MFWNFRKDLKLLLAREESLFQVVKKQRASLTRALMTDPEILILDDSFSAVDTHTEEDILQGLRGFMKNRTTLMVSHRVSTVKDADKIVNP
jgi:ATP-binding cassette subfamily B multidrug efflux pump